MNKRMLIVGMLLGLVAHLWLLWPAITRAHVTSDQVPPTELQQVAVRQLATEPEPKAEAADKPTHQDTDAAPPSALAQAREDIAPAVPTPVALDRLTQDAPTPTMPASGPAPVSDPIVAPVAVIEPVPHGEASNQPKSEPAAVPLEQELLPFNPLQSTMPNSSDSPDIVSAQTAPLPTPTEESQPHEAPLPTLPVPPIDLQRTLEVPPQWEPNTLPPVPPASPSPLPNVQQAVTPPPMVTAVPPRPLRTTGFRSGWSREVALESLPKPSEEILNAVDPRQARAQEAAVNAQMIETFEQSAAVLRKKSAELQLSGISLVSPAAQASPTSAPLAKPIALPIDLKPVEQPPYRPVQFGGRDVTERPQVVSVPAAPTFGEATSSPSPHPASAASAAPVDRGLTRDPFAQPRDPVARIAWGDMSSAMRTLVAGRMILAIVDDSLKVVALLDGSSGTWMRKESSDGLAAFSGRARVVDHTSAFEPLARFCRAQEHLAVLIPVGLEQRITASMEQAVRSQGLTKRQVAACYGKFDLRDGALDFVIDRVERRF